MIQNLKHRVVGLISLARMATDFSNPNRETIDKNFLEAIKDIDKEAGLGLMPGRVVKFSVADGFAYYVVYTVGPRYVNLFHLPYGDNYKSPHVSDDGHAARSVVEKLVEFQDAFTAS